MGLAKLSIGVVLLGILYSTAYCDTSNIFNVLKPNHSSSSSSTHHHKKVHDHHLKIHDGTSIQSDPKAKAKSIPKTKVTTLKNPILIFNSTGNGTFEGRQGWMMESSGWGWPSSSGNMDLYSLLGGLAFLGLLVSVFMFFTNRSSTTPTIVIAGKRRKRDASLGLDEELLGETFSDILNRLGLSIDSPWWNNQEEVDRKNITPYKLV